MAKTDKPAKGDTDEPDTGDDDAGNDEAEKWKRLARKHEARAKQAQAEIADLKGNASSADQSDMDKLRKTVEALTEDLTKERRNSVVAEVAADRGLTKAQARRLKGDTREEIEADADEIVEAFGIKPAKGKPAKGSDGDDDDQGSGKDDDDDAAPFADKSKRSKPKEKLRSGASSESDTDKSGQELADEVWKRTHPGI